MGMFDYVKCLYATPWPDSAECWWQTKTIPEPCLDTYEIRANGTLWHHQKRWVRNRTFTGALEIHAGTQRVVFWFKDGVVKDAVFYEDGRQVE